MNFHDKVVAVLATAAIVGLVTDHILVRGDLQEEIGRSSYIDNAQEKVLLTMDDLKERVKELEVKLGIYHHGHEKD